jgi:hypothetical protein
VTRGKGVFDGMVTGRFSIIGAMATFSRPQRSLDGVDCTTTVSIRVMIARQLSARSQYIGRHAICLSST